VIAAGVISISGSSRGLRLRAFVDGKEALVVEDLRFSGRRRPVGLFVGDGSRGLFRELSVLPA
jgi:hypothetical protein